MKDQDRTKKQLISELEALRRQIAESGASGTSQRSLGNGDGRMGPDDPQWHSLVANTPVFILILDQDGFIRFANHTDSGAPPDQIIGKNLCDFCTPENRENVLGCLQRVFQTGESGVREGPGLRLDHEEHWYASHYGPIFQDGKVVAASLISFKITERKQAEAALLESETRFRKLFQDASVGTTVVSLTGEFLKVNRAFCEFLGYSEQELVGKTVISVTHPDDREESSQAIHQVTQSGFRIQRLEKRYLHKSGRVLWGEVSSTLLCNSEGKPSYFIAQVLDITERKRAEQELAKSKAMLHAAIDCLPFNFFAIGLDGRYMLQNAVSKAHQGGDAIGKLPEEVCPNKHDLAIWLDNNRRAFAGEKIEGEVTLSLGGEERFYYNIIAPIRDGEELHGILGVNIDITERKRAEEALQKAHDELEQRVKERTAELAKANENLDRATMRFKPSTME